MAQRTCQDGDLARCKSTHSQDSELGLSLIIGDLVTIVHTKVSMGNEEGLCLVITKANNSKGLFPLDLLEVVDIAEISEEKADEEQEVSEDAEAKQKRLSRLGAVPIFGSISAADLAGRLHKQKQENAEHKEETSSGQIFTPQPPVPPPQTITTNEENLPLPPKDLLAGIGQVKLKPVADIDEGYVEDPSEKVDPLLESLKVKLSSRPILIDIEEKIKKNTINKTFENQIIDESLKNKLLARRESSDGGGQAVDIFEKIKAKKEPTAEENDGIVNNPFKAMGRASFRVKTSELKVKPVSASNELENAFLKRKSLASEEIKEEVNNQPDNKEIDENFESPFLINLKPVFEEQLVSNSENVVSLEIKSLISGKLKAPIQKPKPVPVPKPKKKFNEDKAIKPQIEPEINDELPPPPLLQPIENVNMIKDEDVDEYFPPPPPELLEINEISDMQQKVIIPPPPQQIGNFFEQFMKVQNPRCDLLQEIREGKQLKKVGKNSGDASKQNKSMESNILTDLMKNVCGARREVLEDSDEEIEPDNDEWEE